MDGLRGERKKRFFQREKPIVLHQYFFNNYFLCQSFLTLYGWVNFFKKTRPKESWDNDGFLTIVYLSH